MADGKVKSIARVKQPILFEGIRYNQITATDIDFFIEARQCYVIGEFKYGDKPMDYGQALALHNLTKELCGQKKHNLMFVASHNVPVDEPVVAGKCRVTKARWNGKLLTDKQLSNITNVKHLVDSFIERHTALKANQENAA